MKLASGPVYLQGQPGDTVSPNTAPGHPAQTFANNYPQERLKAPGSSQAASLAPNQGEKGVSALDRG